MAKHKIIAIAQKCTKIIIDILNIQVIIIAANFWFLMLQYTVRSGYNRLQIFARFTHTYHQPSPPPQTLKIMSMPMLRDNYFT